MKANRQPGAAAVTTERISEVQMSLNYAKQVAQVVKDRRLSELRRRRDELLALPVTHSVDIELRNDLVRELDAQIKQVEST